MAVPGASRSTYGKGQTPKKPQPKSLPGNGNRGIRGSTAKRTPTRKFG